jgi:2-haloacid dehalogenase
MDIDAVAFDLYGTLLEVASVGRAAAEVTDEPAALVDLWRAKQLEYTWLRSLMGRYQDFWATTGDALDYSLDRMGIVVDDAGRSRLLGAWLDVRPYPEVPEALAALAPRKLAVLSNGSPSMLDAGLAAAGIRDRFESVLSVDEVGVYKPHPSVYELAVKALSRPAERILFVSSNAWDASGAKAFGFPVAWVNRAGAPPERLGAPPDLVMAELAALSRVVTGGS